MNEKEVTGERVNDGTRNPNVKPLKEISKMTLEKNEAEAALVFYTAFGNLKRDPDSPTLMQRYETALAELVRVLRANGRIEWQPGFTVQDYTDLRHLLGIAIWIRSEQLATPDVVRMIAANDTTHLPPPIQINTHALSLANCQGDLEHSLEWWKRLAGILDKHQFKGFHSWHINDFAEKK